MVKRRKILIIATTIQASYNHLLPLLMRISIK
nr:MAG TPA: hypothetical protein [Caudoviricetes sp.]